MARMVRVAIAAALIGAMAASVPAAGQIQPPPDAPKSWIPERRTIGDGRAAIVDPSLSEREKREQAERAAEAATLTGEEAMVIDCLASAASKRTIATSPGAGGSKASAAFAEPFTRARDLITSGRLSEALEAVDEAAPHTADPTQELAVEQLRTAIYAGMNQPREVLRSLERQLQSGALSVDMSEQHCMSILGLKKHLGLSPDDSGLEATPD